MIIFIVVYLLFQLWICIWISRKIATSKDFFLAGRSLPTGIVAVSLVATWFGAETCIGSAGKVYAQGLSGSRADPFGYSLCLLLMGLLIAAPLWRGGFITVSDFFAKRFGTSVEKLSAFIIIPGSLLWGAAQTRAFGQVVSSTTNLPVELTIVFCTGFIVVYTFLGGLLGDIYTDVIQGTMIFIGLFCLVVLVLTNDQVDIGWLTTQMDPQRWSLLGANENLSERIDRWAVPILGSLVTQESIARALSSKDARSAQNSSYIACVIYLILGIMPVFLGLLGPHILPGVNDQEQFLAELAKRYLPPFFYVIFVGALISAILSTVNSILLSVSAVTSQNLIFPLIKNRSDKQKLLVARLLIVVAALIAFTLAKLSTGIYELVEAASSFGTAGLVIIMLIGLWSTVGGAWAGSLCLIGGAAFNLAAEHLWELPAPFLSAMIVALVCFFIGTALDNAVKTRRLNRSNKQ